MDKRRAIQIMTRAAELYSVNLEDQKILFLYGMPREVTAAPHQKVYAVLSKNYADEKYFELEKEDKLLNIQECRFTQEIENYLDREKL
jgi:hypothetical protein